MLSAPRILLVQDLSDDMSAIVATLADTGLLDQTSVVRDEVEAFDFLRMNKKVARDTASLPAVILLGPSLPPAKSLHLLQRIREDARLHRIPVVMLVQAGTDAVRRAYELRANGVVVRTGDPQADAEKLSAICSYWAVANIPPPGCVKATV